MRGRFGKLAFQQILAPAIYYAENGYPVTELIAGSWAGAARRMADAPNFAGAWLIKAVARHGFQMVRMSKYCNAVDRCYYGGQLT